VSAFRCLPLPRPARPRVAAGCAATALLLGALAACGTRETDPGGGPTRAAPSTAARSEPLPDPSLDGVEPGVREQLSARRREAEALLEDAAAEPARRAGAVGELGMHYHAYGLAEEAAACYEIAGRLAPEEPRWAHYSAQIERERGRLEQAAAGFERVLAASPAYLPARLALAELEMARGRLAEAGRQADEALRREERSAAGHFLLGQAASLREDFAAAARHYEAALALEPWASSVRYPLGLAYRRLGEEDRAREHLARRGDRRVSLPDPWMREIREIGTGVRAHLFRGSQAMRAGNLEAALAEFEAAVAADAEDPTARLNLGAALAQAGRLGEGAAQLEAALSLDLEPSSRSKAHFNLGALLLMGGERAEAARHLEQALAWDPANEPARRQLAALQGS